MLLIPLPCVVLLSHHSLPVCYSSVGLSGFAFLDDGPDWFKQDEERHNKPIMPVTRQMVDVFKQQLAAINARPIKKIAEVRHCAHLLLFV